MKKLISCILGLCLIAAASFQASAWWNVGVVGGGVPAACNTVVDSQTDTDGDESTGYEAAYTYMAAKVNLGGTRSVCKVGIYLKKVVGDDSPEYAMTVELRDANGAAPSTSVLATSATSLGPSDLDTSYAEEIFEFSSPVSLDDGDYVVLKFTTRGDYGDYVQWAYDNGTFEDVQTSADGTTWTDRSNRHLSYRVYE